MSIFACLRSLGDPVDPMLKDPVKIPCPEKANRGRRTSKKEVFQAKRKKEGRVDASSDPHDRRVKNDIGETIDSR